jgi:energy-coupling factor transporter ATP-binding protein EcfA2
MLTRLAIKNFKNLESADIELGDAVVFIGPNNCGKTSALQALCLWQIGVSKWLERRGDGDVPKKRPGITLNRTELVALPVPAANLLWRDLHTRSRETTSEGPKTKNVFIEIIVEGITNGKTWKCGLEFDYANEESFYCRPLAVGPEERLPVPIEAGSVKVAFLPPMSGLTSEEDRLERGAINVRIGQGRTAEVLRNLCFNVSEQDPKGWMALVDQMRSLFNVVLNRPQFILERGQVRLSYSDVKGNDLDISSAGRGLQQTLLLLSYLRSNPNSALLLDEPDAHLEIIRQRQIYDILTRTAQEFGSQMIAASHSEVILNSAADRDIVVAFVGNPHRIDDRGSQVAKALKEIGFEHYYLAELKKWVLYAEGATDHAVLSAFARKLDHPSKDALEHPFTEYIGNQLSRALNHFHGVKEAVPTLRGVAILDRQDRQIPAAPGLEVVFWNRNEIENYLKLPDVLLRYAEDLAEKNAGSPLFGASEKQRYREAMEQCVAERLPPAALRNPDDIFWQSVKITDQFLDPIFDAFFKKLKLPNLMRKTDYHRLADFMQPDEIHQDIRNALDIVARAADEAMAELQRPRS